MRDVRLTAALALCLTSIALAGGGGVPPSPLTRTEVLKRVPSVLEVRKTRSWEREVRLRVGRETVPVRVMFGASENSPGINNVTVWVPRALVTLGQRQASVFLLQTVLALCAPGPSKEARLASPERWTRAQVGRLERRFSAVSTVWVGQNGRTAASGLQATWSPPQGRERCTW